MPHSAQTITLSGPSIAATLDEFLARHDQSFIHCAYQTLLGRDPDEEGFNYYLGRLGTGIPKMQILGELRRSEEGKAYAAHLLRLDAAIRRYRWAHKAIIGWVVRLFVRVEGNNSTERKLRGLESQLFLLDQENHRRFKQLEKALAEIHHLVLHQAKLAELLGKAGLAEQFEKEVLKITHGFNNQAGSAVCLTHIGEKKMDGGAVEKTDRINSLISTGAVKRVSDLINNN